MDRRKRTLQGPEDLASDPRELPAPISADPGMTEEDTSIYEDTPASMRRLFAAKLRSVRPWAHCRDALELALGTGPRWLPNCRSELDGLSPHGDLGVACLVRSQIEPRPEIQRTCLGWRGTGPERYEPFSRPDRVSLPHRLTWALVGPEDAGVISSRESP